MAPASLGRFTFVSTNNVNIPNVEIKKSDVIEGKSCLSNILGITWGKANDRISTAIQNAIESANKRGIEGDILVDAEILNEYHSWIFGGNNCYVARGRVAKIQKAK